MAVRIDDVDRNAGRVARGAAAMPTISSACRYDTGRYLGTEKSSCDAMCRPKKTKWHSGIVKRSKRMIFSKS